MEVSSYYPLTQKRLHYPGWKVSKYIHAFFIIISSASIAHLSQGSPRDLPQNFWRNLEDCFSSLFSLWRSTVNNMLEFTNFVADSLNTRKDVHPIFTDFSKAFDSINHSLLLDKLWSYGFPTTILSRLRFYLNGRVCLLQWLHPVSFFNYHGYLKAPSSAHFGFHFSWMIFLSYLAVLAFYIQTI